MAAVIKQDIRMEVFYLKVEVTLLNEMLQLLFVPRRHWAGYLLAVQAELCDFITRDRARTGYVLRWLSTF